MKKDLLDFIKALSENDPKTLMQKTLKAQEELGELAKAVLPFIGAPQNSHRFSDKEKILEEVADVTLCVLSVAYNLGVTSEQIEDMISQKSHYWARLQAKERKHPFPIPFELHVTVSPKTDLTLFKGVCEELGVKVVSLDLINPQGDSILDEIMTSSKFYGNNQTVYEELQRITDKLKSVNIEIMREKIETAFWHPSAPSDEGHQKMIKNGYFESHIEILVPQNGMTELLSLAEKYQAVISHNRRKVFADGSRKMILTTRSYQGIFEDFKVKSDELHAALEKADFNPEKEMIEFALYDTKVSHDKEWIKS